MEKRLCLGTYLGYGKGRLSGRESVEQQADTTFGSRCCMGSCLGTKREPLQVKAPLPQARRQGMPELELGATYLLLFWRDTMSAVSGGTRWSGASREI